MRTSDQTHRAPVLAAYSPVTGAREPVEFGVAASRVTGAPLVIVVVVDSGAQAVTLLTHDESVPGSIAAAVKHLENELAERGVAAEVRMFEDSTAARGLARAIDECGPSSSCSAPRSRGAKGALLLGTTAERVIHLSPCPVAVVPHGYQRPEGGVKVIGAAYTPKPEADAALAAADSLARSGGTELRVLTALDPKHAHEEADALVPSTSAASTRTPSSPPRGLRPRGAGESAGDGAGGRPSRHGRRHHRRAGARARRRLRAPGPARHGLARASGRARP